MTSAVEDFDRLMALRMVIPWQEISAASLEEYWAQWPTEELDDFRVLAREYEALEIGEAVIQLPGGSRWISAGALLDIDVYDEDPPGDNTFLKTLHRMLMEHKLSERHFGPLLPQVFLDTRTLDPSRGFCVDCAKWISLRGE